MDTLKRLYGQYILYSAHLLGMTILFISRIRVLFSVQTLAGPNYQRMVIACPFWEMLVLWSPAMVQNNNPPPPPKGALDGPNQVHDLTQ